MPRFAERRYAGAAYCEMSLLLSGRPVLSVLVPHFMLYTSLKWTNTYLPLILPPFLSYGVRGGILLIVFRQFFRGLPYELEDAGPR